jgi:hypothetical protein
MGRLEGKVAIVTGAWRGNGEGIARVLARHGAHVVLTDIAPGVEDVAEYIRRQGQKAMALKMDVTKTDEVNQVVKKVFEKLGRIDILVNNAGIYPPKNLVDTTDEFLQKIFDINVFSMYRCSRAILPIMMKQKYGKIVNLSSVTGLMVSDPAGGWTAYAATKAAVVGFTKSLALEVAQYGINVNCVCPGFVDTPGVRSQSPKDEDPAKYVERIGRNIPMCRMGTPEELGELVLFLASDESKYITGTQVVFDGGNTLQECFAGPYTPK